MITRYEILTSEQRALLPVLEPVRKLGFVLYGGTAVALQLGHRPSIDFDFFSSRAFEEAELIGHLPFLARANTLERAPRTWSVLASASEEKRAVKISFFGGLTMGRVGDPMPTSNGEVLLASPLDLFGHKLKVLLQRIEAKDYLDIAALLRSGLTIEQGLGAAAGLFGPNFPVADALRALTWFKEGQLAPVPQADRQLLAEVTAGAGPVVLIATIADDLALPTRA